MVPVLHPFLRKVKSFSRFACHLAVLCFAPVFCFAQMYLNLFVDSPVFSNLHNLVLTAGAVLYYIGQVETTCAAKTSFFLASASAYRRMKRSGERAQRWCATEGARARNSQVNELIVDGTLESCIAAPKKQSLRGESFRLHNRARLTLARSVLLPVSKRSRTGCPPRDQRKKFFPRRYQRNFIS